MIVSITVMNLSATDLNLFLVFHTVLQERSVTRAAARLHLTQSAVSNALSRLRGLLADPLLVRSGRGVIPTPLALELAPHVAQAVEELERALQHRRPFDPATTTRTFTLGCTDDQELSSLPLLFERFHRQLPKATLHVVSAEEIHEGDCLIDVSLAPTTALREEVHGVFHQILYMETGALLVRRNHPVVRRPTPDRLRSLLHIDVRLMGKSSLAYVASPKELAEHDDRRIALTVPRFMAAAIAAAHTDYAASVPRSFAEAACRMLPLSVILPPAAKCFRYPVSVFWHERTHHDEGAAYFRQLIIEALSDHSTPSSPSPFNGSARTRQRKDLRRSG